MIISRLQHLLKRHGVIKIRELWKRSTIFEAVQFATLSGERKPGFRAMVCDYECGSAEQRS